MRLVEASFDPAPLLPQDNSTLPQATTTIEPRHPQRGGDLSALGSAILGGPMNCGSSCAIWRTVVASSMSLPFLLARLLDDYDDG